MEKKDILEQVINYVTRGNKAEFARRLGIEPQNVSSWISRNSIPADMVELILLTFPAISADFLVLGKGGVARCFVDDKNELSFRDYIDNIKKITDEAGACATINEFVTGDGYKITIKVEKTSK